MPRSPASPRRRTRSRSRERIESLPAAAAASSALAAKTQPVHGRYLVTGGGGYFGRLLVKMLLQRGAELVVSFDVRAAPEPEDASEAGRFRMVTGDIRKYDDVQAAFEGMRGGTVFHVASYGMSGAQMMQRQLTREVNVGGTEHIIKACQESDIRALVYTSTVNVVFANSPISAGDETLPYPPPGTHSDEYSNTKIIAEQMILKANGAPLTGGGYLQTASIRPCGIYGEGEERHQPRIIKTMHQRLFAFTIGDAAAKVDWVHGENLAHGHICCAQALQNRNEQAAGQAFFITDGNPINNFEFLRPLCQGLGFTYPRIRLPVWFMWMLATLLEWTHAVFSRVVSFTPFLTRAEVVQVGVEHYWSIEKARRVLNYAPILDPAVAMQRTVDYHIKRGDSCRPLPVYRIAASLVLILFALYFGYSSF